MPDDDLSEADLRLIAKALRGYRANRMHKEHFKGVGQLRRLEDRFTALADAVAHRRRSSRPPRPPREP